MLSVKYSLHLVVNYMCNQWFIYLGFANKISCANTMFQFFYLWNSIILNNYEVHSNQNIRGLPKDACNGAS